MGLSPPSSTYNKDRLGLPFLQGITEFGEISPSPTIYCSEPVKKAQGDDILLSVRAPVGEVNIAREEYCIGRGVAAIRPNAKLNNRFLFYYLKFHRSRLENHSAGSTFKQVTRKDIERFSISVPSLTEQEQITNMLWTIDQVIQQTHEIISKTQRLKQGIMQELLTKGIGHKEFKDSAIGRIPTEWQAVSLGDVLEICQYGLSIPLMENGRYPIVRMNEIVDGYIAEHIAKFVDLDSETLQKYKLEKGDVLFNRTNSLDLVGRTGLFELDGNYVFASYLIRLRPKRDMLDSHFLTYQLIFFRDRLIQYVTKAVHQANINATNLRKVMIAAPPFKEQVEVSHILRNLDYSLTTESEELSRLEKVRQGFMDLLLTGKVRVKADSN